MPVWLAALLGVVQGLTEFLPVSSSGHLALFQNLFNMSQYTDNHIAFDIVLHLGTLFAVVVAFWPDIVGLVRDFFGWVGDGFKVKKIPGRRRIVMLIIATLPLAVGALLESAVSAAFQSTLLIGCALLFTSVLLYLADRLGHGHKTARDASYKSALVVGLMQLVAIIPGVSRSGSTICGGLFTGFDRQFAVRFAFLLSIPAVVGAAVFQLPDIASAAGDGLLVYAVGFLTAAVSGYLAIRLVRLLMKKNSFKVFSVYCAVVGVLSIVFSLV